MKLIVFMDMSEGGIADYAHDQATALAARGIDITMLTSPEFVAKRTPRYRTLPILEELRAGKLAQSRWRRRIGLARGLLRNKRRLVAHVKREGRVDVLLHFSEYLAPFWAPMLHRLRKRGARFHSVLHDPVRDYQVGPLWWHEWSVRAAFAPLSNVFVHTREAVPVAVPTTWIPYGVHSYPSPARSRADVRAELGIDQNARLITAYGYIRDNKNLDLVIEALAAVPDVHLLVAGPEQAGGNKPLPYYRELAEKHGVASRCHWVHRFLTGTETADYLAASDLSVLTYSRTFVSSSAALGVTANYDLPCLISSGSASNRDMVRTYGLGIWVEPDSVEAIREGLLRWLHEGISPRWEDYRRDFSWNRNAELIEQRIRRDGNG